MKELIFKSLKDINFIAVIIVAICYNVIMTDADSDLWSRIYCGAAYLDNGWVLYKDIFAFTQTKPLWVDHEWLSGIIFYKAIDWFGYSGILILKLFCIITEIWLIYLCARLRDDSTKNILFLLIVLFAIEPAFCTNIRPHNFTYMFFTLWLFILEYSRINNTTKCLWILPVTIPLWANLHAGCIAGIALLGVYAFSQLIQKKEYKIYAVIYTCFNFIDNDKPLWVQLLCLCL